jgi:predicted  nucleic acid-binding Zn-ribbon protein
MNPDTVRAIFQSVTSVFLGGGLLALARFLLPKMRRAELRTLDTTSDATALTSANTYIGTLQADRNALRDEILTIKAELKSAQKVWDAERLASTEALENASREISRFTAELARVRADLIVAQSQILELGARLSSLRQQQTPGAED